MKPKININKNEYLALYMSDDSIGMTSLIAKELSMTFEQVNRLMDNLVKKDLVIKSKGDLPKGEYWYYTTELGKNALKKSR